MKFEEVVAAFREGKRVRRESWPINAYIFFMNDNIDGDIDGDYIDPTRLNIRNCLYTDWIIIEETEDKHG